MQLHELPVAQLFILPNWILRNRTQTWLQFDILTATVVEAVYDHIYECVYIYINILYIYTLPKTNVAPV